MIDPCYAEYNVTWNKGSFDACTWGKGQLHVNNVSFTLKNATQGSLLIIRIILMHVLA